MKIQAEAEVVDLPLEVASDHRGDGIEVEKSEGSKVRSQSEVWWAWLEGYLAGWDQGA